jgi:hypothetical protein
LGNFFTLTYSFLLSKQYWQSVPNCLIRVKVITKD